MLTRLGNKKGLADKIYTHFPNHRMRITLFFGAGGMYFNTPKSKFNIINDLDDDITNLYLVVTEKSDELIDAICAIPISKTLLKFWRKKIPEAPVQRAVRFLLLSNFTYLGKGDTIRFGVGKEKENLIANITKTLTYFGDDRIMNEDFRNVIKKVSFSKTTLAKEDSFIYLDPVYLGTEHYYRVPAWKEEDTFDCFEIMSREGIPAAMSAFSHPFILHEAQKRDFNIIPIKARHNIKGKALEILVTNYSPQNILF